MRQVEDEDVSTATVELQLALGHALGLIQLNHQPTQSISAIDTALKRAFLFRKLRLLAKNIDGDGDYEQLLLDTQGDGSDPLAVYNQLISLVFTQDNIDGDNIYPVIVLKLIHVLVCAWIIQNDLSSPLKLISFISQQKHVRELIDRAVENSAQLNTPHDTFLKQISQGVFVFNPEARAHELNSSLFDANSVVQKKPKKKERSHDVVDDIITLIYFEALINYKKKESANAAASLDLLLKLDKQYWPGYFLKGVLHFTGGEYELSNMCFEACLRDRSKHRTADCLIFCGCILALQKKYWTAIERFKEAIKIDADNHLAMYYVSIIYAILDKKDAEHRMLEFLLKAIESKNGNDSPNNSAIVLYKEQQSLKKLLSAETIRYKMCLSLIAQDRCSDASLSFKQLISNLIKTDGEQRLTESSVIIFRDYIYVLIQTNQLREALKMCNYVLQIERHDVAILMYKADVLVNHEKPAESLQCLDSVLDILNAIAARHEHGVMADVDAEIEERATKRQRVDNWFEVGGHRIEKNGSNAALFDADKRRSLKIDVYINRGIVLQCLRRYEEALKMFSKASLMAPDNIEAKYNQVALLYRIERKKDACREWLEFRKIDLDPHSSAYMTLLHNIDLQYHSTPEPQIVSHVSGSVSTWQLLLLDRLVLHTWSELNPRSMDLLDLNLDD
jgi:tetratricopeptide (TPR) repeat protein